MSERATNQPDDAAVLNPREGVGLQAARNHAFHCLEFVPYGVPASQDELAACRNALIRTFDDFGTEFVERAVDQLQERGALPSMVEMERFAVDSVPEERRAEVADRILAPLAAGALATPELIKRLEGQAVTEMIGFVEERLLALNEKLAAEEMQIEDDRMARSVAVASGEYLLVDARDGFPGQADLEALVGAAWSGRVKAITLIARDGEEVDRAAGLRALLHTGACRYYMVSEVDFARMAPEKHRDIEASIRSGRTAVVGRAAEPKTAILSELGAAKPAPQVGRGEAR